MNVSHELWQEGLCRGEVTVPAEEGAHEEQPRLAGSPRLSPGRRAQPRWQSPAPVQ